MTTECDLSPKNRTMNSMRFPANLGIQRHEFASVVGPSGCAKSTLLRMVSGLLLQSHGKVSVFGQPVAGPSEDDLLPQQSWLSVYGVSATPAKTGAMAA